MESKSVKKKTIRFIRHAQSVQNVHEDWAHENVRNARLTDLGKEQASKLSHTCELLIVSPMRRTMETYAHSNLKVGKLVTSELVREIMNCPGSEMDLKSTEKPETIDDVKVRAKEAVKFIYEQPYETITVLTHAIFLLTIMEVLGKPIDKMIDNCEMLVLEDHAMPDI